MFGIMTGTIVNAILVIIGGAIGAILKKNTGYVINNLQEIELHKLYKPKVALSAESLKQTAENQYSSKSLIVEVTSL